MTNERRVVASGGAKGDTHVDSSVRFTKANIVMTNRRVCAFNATFGILALALGACSGQRCVNQAIIGLPSPDGARIAYVFHRTCNDGPVTTHVSVISLPNSLRDETGNVLTAAGDQPIKIAWRSPTNLRVTGFTDSVYKIDHPLGTVTVDFPESPR